MAEININLINHLSHGLLKNIAIFEKALDAANEVGIDTSEYIVSKETVLAIFNRSNGDVDEMKKMASDCNKWDFSVFDEEADRVNQEMTAQTSLLRRLLGFKEFSIDPAPLEIQMIKLRNLALAGFAVSKED